MKRYLKYIIIFTAVAGILVGCSEDWLHIENQTLSTAEDFYQTEDDAIKAVTSAYDIMKWRGSYGLAIPFVMYGFDEYIAFEFAPYNEFTLTAGEGYVDNIYEGMYRGVYRCNKVLEKVPDIDMDADLKARCLAEARCLRAFYNFHLVTYFNEPPIITEVIYNIEDGILGNTPQEVWWDTIESDLTKAAAVLPTEYDAANKGRMTKGAALALLGKAHLYQQEWADAKTTFEQVISLADAGVYELITPLTNDSSDYVNAFLSNYSYIDLTSYTGNTYTGENNKESIWEIQSNNDPEHWNQWLPGYGINGHMLSAYFAPIGYRNTATRAKYADLFEKAPVDHPAGVEWDPRRYGTLWADGDTLEYREGFPDYGTAFKASSHANALHAEGYGIRKYYFPLLSDPALDLAPSGYNDPNNIRFIRYADVLLMYAEACYHTGNLDRSAWAINQVRARAGMPAYAEGDITPQVIMLERDLELGMEFGHFTDVVRWNNLDDPRVSTGTAAENWITDAEAMNRMSGFVPDKHRYMAIPIVEIDRMLGNLQQNPGW